MTARDFTARRVGIALTVIATAVIAYATLSPAGALVDRSLYGPVCVICDGTPGVDLIANVVLFVPLGIGLVLAGTRSGRAIAAMAALSLAIELLQYRFIQGRDASFVDVATNVIGGSLGVAAGKHWRVLVAPDARASALSSATAALVLVATIWATAWGLTPSLPEPPWFSIRSAGTPLKPSGRIVDARVAGEPLTGDSVRNGETVRAGLLQGEPAVVTAIVSASGEQSTNLLQVIDRSIDDVVVLSRVKQDAPFSARNRARGARLRELAVRLRGFFRGFGEDTVHVAGRVQNGSLIIQARHAGNVREQTLPLTPRLGWALLFPTTRLGSESVLAGGIWIAALLLPFSYWSARAARLSGNRRLWWLARAVVVIACFALPARVMPIATSLWWEWAVGILTIVAGEIVVASSLERWDASRQRARSSFDVP